MSNYVVLGTSEFRTIVTEKFEKAIFCGECPSFVRGVSCEKCRKEENDKEGVMRCKYIK